MELEWVGKRPHLDAPALIAAFQGWSDAGEAASGALDALAEALEPRTLATLDPEPFLDFQISRPTIRGHGARRRIIWPKPRFRWASAVGGDVILLESHEPNLRWRTFAQHVVDVAQAAGVRRVVTLGALQVDQPHTRALTLTGWSDPPALAEDLGLGVSRYEGPTGITGVVTLACAAAGLETLTLWVGVPHYLSGTAYLQASHDLAAAACRATGLTVALEGLADAAERQQEDIAKLVTEDEDLASYVSELEERTDRDDLSARMVTGEELAAAFERYLRDRPGE